MENQIDGDRLIILLHSERLKTNKIIRENQESKELKWLKGWHDGLYYAMRIVSDMTGNHHKGTGRSEIINDKDFTF